MVLSAREVTLSEHCAERVKKLVQCRRRGLGEDALAALFVLFGMRRVFRTGVVCH